MAVFFWGVDIFLHLENQNVHLSTSGFFCGTLSGWNQKLSSSSREIGLQRRCWGGNNPSWQQHTVDGPKSPFPTTWDGAKTQWKMGYSPYQQVIAGFCEPSTVCHFFSPNISYLKWRNPDLQVSCMYLRNSLNLKGSGSPPFLGTWISWWLFCRFMGMIYLYLYMFIVNFDGIQANIPWPLILWVCLGGCFRLPKGENIVWKGRKKAHNIFSLGGGFKYLSFSNVVQPYLEKWWNIWLICFNWIEHHQLDS